MRRVFFSVGCLFAILAILGSVNAQMGYGASWTSDPAMSANITVPTSGVSVPTGTTLTCKVDASDFDTRWYSGSPSLFTDSLTITWSCSGGSFVGGNTSFEVSWQAPQTAGSYSLSV